jgi:hypothetical protein
MNSLHEKRKLSNLIYLNHGKCRWVRRKVSESLRIIRSWFNFELRMPEHLPKEFQEYEPYNERIDHKDWRKHL